MDEVEHHIASSHGEVAQRAGRRDPEPGCQLDDDVTIADAGTGDDPVSVELAGYGFGGGIPLPARVRTGGKYTLGMAASDLLLGVPLEQICWFCQWAAATMAAMQAPWFLKGPRDRADGDPVNGVSMYTQRSRAV